MSIADIYRTPQDLPRLIAVFPLPGVLLLPRAQLPLNVFEPRYVAMVNDAMSGERVIGMIQPDFAVAPEQVDDPDARPPLQKVGCAGRITSFAETGDGRILITLTGIARFEILRELEIKTPYRRCEIDCTRFAGDLEPGRGEGEVDRTRLLETLRAYLQAKELQADWESLEQASSEALVNGLSMIAPCGPQEKQALLEAPDLKSRNKALITLTEMALADGDRPGTETLQ